MRKIDINTLNTLADIDAILLSTKEGMVNLEEFGIDPEMSKEEKIDFIKKNQNSVLDIYTKE